MRKKLAKIWISLARLMSEKEFLVEWKAPCGFDDWLLLSFYYLQSGE